MDQLPGTVDVEAEAGLPSEPVEFERETPAIGHAEHRPGWRGILREFATIVAGVLVALAGQAWWSSREDAVREHDYLRQLLVDTRENEEQLTNALRFDRSVRDAEAALATALYAPRPLPTPDSLRVLFDGPIFASSNLEPRIGTYTALLSSGDIRLIRTDTLRAQLIAYSAQLQSDGEMLRLYLEQAFLDPGRIARVFPFTRRLFVTLSDTEERAARVGDAATMSRLRDNPEVGSALFALQVANGNRVQHIGTLLRLTTRLRRTLEAERALRDDVARFRTADSARVRQVAADSVRRAGGRAPR